MNDLFPTLIGVIAGVIMGIAIYMIFDNNRRLP